MPLCLRLDVVTEGNSNVFPELKNSAGLDIACFWTSVPELLLQAAPCLSLTGL